jgi:hypothetical protein
VAGLALHKAMAQPCNTQVLHLNPACSRVFLDQKFSICYNNGIQSKKEPDMKAQELETKSAGYFAYAAMRDARMRAVAMWSHYTDKERVRAERMKIGLEQVYAGMVYVNPRGKFIAVKVDQPQVRDRKNLALLEKDYVLEGITKVLTKQGITYRIPKI